MLTKIIVCLFAGMGAGLGTVCGTVGAASHFVIGGKPELLNRVTGVILVILGVAMVIVKNI